MKVEEPLLEQMPLTERGEKDVFLFYPFVPPEAIVELADTLKTRWIGQGPKVERFEKQFSAAECGGLPAIAIGSGTAALHLAYRLCDVDEDSEVIAPVFTCAATNIPLLYDRAKIKFVDTQPNSLNIDVKAIENLITEKTKAIVVVHYGGLPCDLDELARLERKYNVPVIQDGAHAVGMRWRGEPIASCSRLTMYSFQAIKHITTADGGMLVINDTGNELAKKCRRLRWFGVDRERKQGGIWENDILETGYKYQMTDLGACLGLAGLGHIDRIVDHRRKLLSLYEERLQDIPGITFFSGSVKDEHGAYKHAAWLCTVLAENRAGLKKKLHANKIEADQVHYRNDRYSIFKEHVKSVSFPNMDSIEGKYLVLPMHHLVTEDDVARICDLIRQGW